MVSEALTPDAVPAFFQSRGWFADRRILQVTPLAGGVSSTVLRVEWADGGSVVVKQPLPRLRVATDWRSDPARALNEAAGLEVAAACLPAGSAPRLHAVDARAHVLVMEALPVTAPTWKARLLAGDTDPRWALLAGDRLGRLHAGSWQRAALAERVADGYRYFEELRLRPYFEFLLPQYPTLRRSLENLLAELRATRQCVVHGDFSPKNLIVVEPDRLVILDWEVVHYGDPRFDCAFVLTHLALKAVHVGGRNPTPFWRLMERFWDAYCRVQPEAPPWPGVAVVLGGLLLARVDGQSPVEYLTPDEKPRVREWARRILTHPPDTLDALAECLPEGAA
jgi:tRNA A-37 threonylcarbamoyl transferase component Bud32